VLTPDRLCRALGEVTVVHSGPSLLGSLFQYLRTEPGAPKSLPNLRHASSGGDLVPPSIMEEMKRVFPNAELFVIYGCTEVSCMGTTFPISREAKVNRTFVGKAFPNVTVQVLDANRKLVPFGVVGEICFAGKGVVRGYLDRPELTAEKFVPLEGRRFYQTGDMGRLHPDGNVEILGRRDFQVQLRGIRIELAGIEKTVQELGLAAQCAVVARTAKEGDVRLVAFIVRPRDLQVATFRRALADQLPAYMLPHHVVVLDAMPLTANGKLDRNRLKEMPWDAPRATEAEPPRSELERKIAEVFAHVLGLNAIGVEDSFFDLGGDSLLAVVALQEVADAIGMKVPPHVLFESATVRGFAADIEGGVPSASRPILLNERGAGPDVFAISGGYTYRKLAEHLEGHCNLYGVLAQGELGAFEAGDDFRSIEELARDYVGIIRRQQRHGPYWILGYSFAGIVAYEVAQQLRDTGEEIRFLSLIDPYLPEWDLGWRFRLAQLRRLLSAPRRDVASFFSRRLRERLGISSSSSESGNTGFIEQHENEKLSVLEERRFASKTNAASGYLPRIRPFPGHVSLIVSGDRLRGDPLKSPTCGWGPYVASLDVSSVDVHHLRMLFDEPHVGRIGELLMKALEDAGAPSTARASFGSSGLAG
jgi:thioesterase domain-containing protein/acyl carrier protein